ncbi:ADP-ribosylation factor-like protein 4C-like 2, partial [Homarus americanus]
GKRCVVRLDTVCGSVLTFLTRLYIPSRPVPLHTTLTAVLPYHHQLLLLQDGVARAVEGVVKRRKHVVLVGLDGSGKTTVLTRLKYRCYVATTPTIGFNHEKVWGGGYRWSCWDVGGGERLRPLWSSYTRATDGLVFVVDSASLGDMMEEARKSRASSAQLGVPTPPLLVLANFQDQIHARSAQGVAMSLGLGEAMGVVWAVAPVCALTGEGLDDAMATLRNLIDKVRQDYRRRDPCTSCTSDYDIYDKMRCRSSMEDYGNCTSVYEVYTIAKKSYKLPNENDTSASSSSWLTAVGHHLGTERMPDGLMRVGGLHTAGITVKRHATTTDPSHLVFIGYIGCLKITSGSTNVLTLFCFVQLLGVVNIRSFGYDSPTLFP